MSDTVSRPILPDHPHGRTLTPPPGVKLVGWHVVPGDHLLILHDSRIPTGAANLHVATCDMEIVSEPMDFDAASEILEDCWRTPSVPLADRIRNPHEDFSPITVPDGVLASA